MTYPSLAEVEQASRYQLCYWWRWLPSPRCESEVAVMSRLAERFHSLGGFTPQISKAIGWEHA